MGNDGSRVTDPDMITSPTSLAGSPTQCYLDQVADLRHLSDEEFHRPIRRLREDLHTRPAVIEQPEGAGILSVVTAGRVAADARSSIPARADRRGDR